LLWEVVVVGAADSPLIRDALRAWMRGDLDALEQALAEDAELLWFESGPWDCHSREEIMALLRRRAAEGRPVYEVRIEDVDENCLVVSSARPQQRACPEDAARATQVTLRAGKIARMRQYRSHEQALAATA
jgi:ketosteroid isomerase-like protein